MTTQTDTQQLSFGFAQDEADRERDMAYDALCARSAAVLSAGRVALARAADFDARGVLPARARILVERIRTNVEDFPELEDGSNDDPVVISYDFPVELDDDWSTDEEAVALLSTPVGDNSETSPVSDALTDFAQGVSRGVSGIAKGFSSAFRSVAAVFTPKPASPDNGARELVQLADSVEDEIGEQWVLIVTAKPAAQTPEPTPASILVQKPRKRVSFAADMDDSATHTVDDDADTSDDEFDATCAQPQRPASCPVRTFKKWEPPIDVGVQTRAETRKRATIEAAGILMSFADELTGDVAAEMRALLAGDPDNNTRIQRDVATAIADN